MKLKIGEKLKELRCERSITQEQLADLLGVSCQSVSRWELGACYPDIELLPVIANYFDVSLDDLVGMRDIRSEKKRSEIFTVALDLERQQDLDGAIAVLRSALKTYPNDDGFSAELALALSRTQERTHLMEAVSLSEAVLARSTNEKIRSTVRANLCFLYKETGQNEKAYSLGRTLPHIWECREMLLPDLAADGRETEMARSFDIAWQVLRDVALQNGISFALGYRSEGDAEGEGLLEYVKR